MRRRKRRRRRLLGAFILIAISLVLVFFGFRKNSQRSHSMEIDNVERHISQLKTEYQEITQYLSEFYINDKEYFIKGPIQQSEIDASIEKVGDFEGTFVETVNLINGLSLKEQNKFHQRLEDAGLTRAVEQFQMVIADIEMKQTVTNEINKIFLSTYLIGNSVDEDVIIVDDLNTQTLEKVQETVQTELENSVSERTRTFASVIQEGLKIAEDQLFIVNRARELAEELFDGMEVKSNANSILLDAFKELVQDIKNDNIRASFNSNIKSIDVFLTEAQTEEEEREEVQISTGESAADTGSRPNNQQNDNSSPSGETVPMSPEETEEESEGEENTENPILNPEETEEEKESESETELPENAENNEESTDETD